MNSGANTDSLLRISSCSYEGSLFGWDLVDQSVPVSESSNKKKGKTPIDGVVAESQSFETVMSYGLNVCEGCLKAVAISQRGKHLVTGGSDERIRIFDLKDNRAVGEISTHTGAITSLHFFGDTYLMSGSDDCTLCIWRVHDWQCVHILGGHKGPVSDFSIHPTGKLALSVSKDSTMKLWNLVQGRCAFTRRLKKPADSVLWHESGLYYSLTIGNEVQLYLASDNSCVSSIVKKSRINKALFTKVDNVKTGSDAGKISASWRMAVICEDKTLSLFSFDGVQTATVDLSVLGIGRPRDMWSGAISNHNTNSQQLSQGIKGHCVVLVSSTGLVLTLNAAAMEMTSETAEGKSGDVDKEELGVLGNCLLSHFQIKVEPRLTAVVAWSANKSYASDNAEDVISASAPASAPVQSDAADSEDEEEDEEVPKVSVKKQKQFSKANSSKNNKKRKLEAK